MGILNDKRCNQPVTVIGTAFIEVIIGGYKKYIIRADIAKNAKVPKIIRISINTIF